jgi:hypothetical protein
MRRPQLTFFCELNNDALQALLAQPSIINDLLHLQASVSLALLDLSAERAAVVRRLNEVGIPVVAWLLLPKDQGYFLTMDNLPQMAARYTDFQAWTAQYNLCWAGLDLELDIREFQQFAQNP